MSISLQAGDELSSTEPEVKPEEQPTAEKPAPRRRGFAAMDRSAVRAIARKGGVAAHARGTAHRFSHEEAQEAGRKGGRAPHKSRGRPYRPSEEADAGGTTGI